MWGASDRPSPMVPASVYVSGRRRLDNGGPAQRGLVGNTGLRPPLSDDTLGLDGASTRSQARHDYQRAPNDRRPRNLCTGTAAGAVDTRGAQQSAQSAPSEATLAQIKLTHGALAAMETTGDAAALPQRTLDETRTLWNGLFGGRFASLTALKSAVVNGSAVCDDTLRSVAWRLFMLLPDLPTDTWGDILARERAEYAGLREQFTAHLRTAEAAVDDTNVNNPLSEDSSNPWKTYWQDEELRREILQDIERTFPDIDYFRDPAVQQTMLDILFVYTKLHADLSYQQGMHELLAPIYWAVARDAVDVPAEPAPEDAPMLAMLAAEHVEADAYALFAHVMRHAAAWYGAPAKPGALPPITLKSKRIQDVYLRNIDPELERHLRVLAVEPQLWGIRWIRLLFGREFDFYQTQRLWDCIFAADASSLDIVDFVCVAMLLRIRPQLLAADYTGVLTLLLRYPIDDATALNTFVEDAVYLQVHQTPAGGRRITSQYFLPTDVDEDALHQPYHVVNGVLVSARSNADQRARLVERTVNGARSALESSARSALDSNERWNGVNKYMRERVQDAREKYADVRVRYNDVRQDVREKYDVVRERAAQAVSSATAIANATSTAGYSNIRYLTPDSPEVSSLPPPRPPPRAPL
ncbi:rab-GTPase-TBC domain-containing protein, partial [Dipodascopsis tothii]|uniref:rab-GTPase-TBC domain-containing protein n=1 Tax=Dipodascopsis tothii TaxID=44089 RepID=UPI0034CD1D09